MRHETIKPKWLQIMRQVARQLVQPHPLLNLDDLESVGNGAVLEVLAKYDPNADPVRFESMLRLCVKRRIQDEIRSVTGCRNAHRKAHDAMPTTPAGVLVPLVDQTADDPAAMAEVREMAAGLPSPAEVRVKAQMLKAAVLNAMSADDVTDMIQAQVRKAKGGDTKAARLCLQVIGVSVASVDASDL